MVLIDSGLEEWKWEQRPDLSTTGIDVNCTEPSILADDFLCEQPGRLTHIDIWGSWLSDYLPFGDNPVAVDFILSLHEDIPADESPTGFSMPGDVLWIHPFRGGAVHGPDVCGRDRRRLDGSAGAVYVPGRLDLLDVLVRHSAGGGVSSGRYAGLGCCVLAGCPGVPARLRGALRLEDDARSLKRRRGLEYRDGAPLGSME